MKHIIIVSLPKEPAWVTEEKRLVKTKKGRASTKIELVKQEQMLKDDAYSSKDVVNEVLSYINENDFLIELLVPKLNEGGEIYMKEKAREKEIRQRERVVAAEKNKGDKW